MARRSRVNGRVVPGRDTRGNRPINPSGNRTTSSSTSAASAATRNSRTSVNPGVRLPNSARAGQNLPRAGANALRTVTQGARPANPAASVRGLRLPAVSGRLVRGLGIVGAGLAVADQARQVFNPNDNIVRSLGQLGGIIIGDARRRRAENNAATRNQALPRTTTEQARNFVRLGQNGAPAYQPGVSPRPSATSSGSRSTNTQRRTTGGGSRSTATTPPPTRPSGGGNRPTSAPTSRPSSGSSNRSNAPATRPSSPAPQAPKPQPTPPKPSTSGVGPVSDGELYSDKLRIVSIEKSGSDAERRRAFLDAKDSQAGAKAVRELLDKRKKRMNE